MFVRSRMSTPVVYRKGGYSWTINPSTTTYIDETKVTAKELKACYGDRIDVMSLDNEYVAPVIEAPEPVKEKEVKTEPFTEKLDEQLIDNILEEIEAEETAQVTEQVAEETEQVAGIEPLEQITPVDAVVEGTEQLEEAPVGKKATAKKKTSGKKSNKK